MNSEEISKIKQDMLHHENWHDENSKERKLYEEMCLRSMIMSCLTYNNNIYSSDYVLKYNKILGKDRVFEICKEQENYFKTKCKIIYNVWTDCDGITYNSLVEVE